MLVFEVDFLNLVFEFSCLYLFLGEKMIYLNLLAVGFGAFFGGISRYLLSAKFNSLFNFLPFGTLIANLTGAYLIGLFMAWLFANPSISSLLKLFLITGFLGALTTFSTFSYEVFDMLKQGLIVNAFATIAIHLFGSLFCTFLGYSSLNLIKAL